MIKIIEPNPLENTLSGHIKLLSLIITIKLQSVVAKIYTVIKSKRFTLKPDHLYFMVNCSVLSLVRFHLLRFTYFLEVLLLYKLNGLLQILELSHKVFVEHINPLLIF